MGRLEAFKPTVAHLLGQEGKGAVYAYTFALKIFAKADSEDRSGNVADYHRLALAFNDAALFFELLKQFEGAFDEEVEEKYKYARFKAVSISKSLREGKKPAVGNPTEAAPSLPTPAPQPSPDANLIDLFPSVPNLPSQPATFPTPGPSADPPRHVDLFPPVPGANRAEQPIPTVPGASPNLLDLFPTIPTNTASAAPTFDSLFALPKVPSNNITPVTPVTPVNPPHPTVPTQPRPQDPPRYVEPPKQVQPAPKPAEPTPSRPVETPRSTTGGYKPDEDDIAAAQKYTKFVTSALNYEDVPTAVKYLNLSLKILQEGKKAAGV